VQTRGSLEEQQARAARAKQRCDDLQKRIATASRRQRELETERAALAVSEQLATDLRGDNFQEFLLEETFRELVRGGSERLWKLSGRYRMRWHDGSFFVVDHDNGQQSRSAETLSGGETFLAALSLALELSAQVQRLQGALVLESLFIDEGFGALDPETLEVVSEAITALPAGGKKVGIITHIRELSERLPARITVEKGPEGARVSVECDR
jgi:exonuclease SbcC